MFLILANPENGNSLDFMKIPNSVTPSTKPKKNIPRKSRELSLYSPEYLAKKHGIKINDIKPKKVSKQMKEKNV